NYLEEERFNEYFEEPAPGWREWILEVHPSPLNSSQERSVISISRGEQDFRGYNQDGFDSFMPSDSESSNSENLYAWMRNNAMHRNENGRASSSEEEGSESPANVHQPMEETMEDHLQQHSSPTNFVTSDIEANFEVVSDYSSSSSSRTPIPGQKRPNPEQQAYLISSAIGTSSATNLSRNCSREELNRWASQSTPAKRYKSSFVELSSPNNLNQNQPNNSSTNNSIESKAGRTSG
ncbi:hypothetical protein MKX03_023774, partial [Papaver bracteatum]